MNVWAIAAAAAEQQHLVLATWQLTALGLSHSAVHEHVRRHGWRRDDLGAIWLPGEDTPVRRVAAAYLALSKPAEAWTRVAVDDWDDVEGVADALVAAARDSGVVICGPTAAWLHGMTEHPDDDVWLLIGAHAGRDRRLGVRLRYGEVTSEMWEEVDGLPVLNPEFTIIDNARVPQVSPVHRHYYLLRLLRHAHRLRLTTPAKVGALLPEVGKFRGKPVLREVLADLAGELSHSAAEALARALVAEVLAEFGLALHPEPYAITLDGTRVAEADLAVLAIRYDIEIDGPHHDLPEQQERDRNRDRLVLEAGWFPERFRTELVELHPQTFKAQVRQTVRRLLRDHPQSQRFSLESGALP